MKAFRTAGLLLALATLSVLAACGGGGGGGVNPPTGGGGGGPTATPSGAPTASPTSSPTSAPTASPTNAPTASPTSSPAGVAVDAGWTISAAEDVVNGSQWYSSGNAPWANTAGPTSASGATGGTFDGMQCADTPEGVTGTGQAAFPAGKFTQHAFVGVINSSGREDALPQAIGFVAPQAPTTSGSPNAPGGHPNNNYPVELYNCSYNVHTHDYSGLVHIEDTSFAQSTISAPSYASLQTLLDEWGATLDLGAGLTAGGSSVPGAVTIYVGTPGAGGVVTSYSAYSGALNALMLTHHTTVWIVIGTTPASIPPFNPATPQNGLPQVRWQVED